jgi:hypothetical protein
MFLIGSIWGFLSPATPDKIGSLKLVGKPLVLNSNFSGEPAAPELPPAFPEGALALGLPAPL